MSTVTVRELSLGEMPAAAALLGRAMGDNPINVRAAGADSARREQMFGRIFVPMLAAQHARGPVLGAETGGRLIGVCGLVAPGKCQPGGKEKLAMLRTVFTETSLGVTVNAVRWLGAWAKRDPQEPHWHLGPVGVVQEWRGQGVGSALLAAACAHVDRTREAAYLETDKDVNVRFYERFGFQTVSEARVLGVPNWFMYRAAQCKQGHRVVRVVTDFHIGDCVGLETDAHR